MSAAETPARASGPASAPAEDTRPVLPFERWAEVAASLLKRSRDERLDLLEEQEIDPLHWDRSDRHWVTQIADDLDGGSSERPAFYAARCAAEMARRRQAAQPEAAQPDAARPEGDAAKDFQAQPPEPVPAVAAFEPVSALAASEPAPALIAPPVAMPAFIAAPMAMPAMLAMPAHAAPSVEPPAIIAMPAHAAPAIEPPAIIAMPAHAAPAIEPPAIIAMPAHAAPSIESRVPGPPPAAARLLTSTVSNVPMPLPDLSKGLPFGGTPSLDLSQPVVRTSPEPGMSTGTAPVPSDLMARVMAAVPFSKRPGAASPAATPAPAPVPAAVAPPAAAPAPAAVPAMTVDSYASLCAELSVYPERRADIYRRYGLADETGQRAVDLQWKELFNQNPAAGAQWQSKYKAFREWLVKMDERQPR